MLIQALIQKTRASAAPKEPAFQKKPIRWIIPLDCNGNLCGMGLIETKGEGKRGEEFLAPATSRDKSSGGMAEFMSDGLTAVFGLDTDPDSLEKMEKKKRETRLKNNLAKREHFWEQICGCATITGNQLVASIGRFGDALNGCSHPSFLRYGYKEDVQKGKEVRKWWVRTAVGTEVGLGNDSFTFQVDGVLMILDEETIKPHWKMLYGKELEERASSSRVGLCLATGATGVCIADTHLPKITGIPGGPSYGTAIVSFDKPSFCSFGLTQSHNAPMSLEAVAAYTSSLQELIDQEDNNLRVQESLICYWARNASTSTFSTLLKRPDPKTVSDFLRSPWGGMDRNHARTDPFYSVTLGATGGRIVVRHWMQQTVEQAHENFGSWFRDLDVVAFAAPLSTDDDEPKEGKGRTAASGETEPLCSLAIRNLAATTVRDPKDIRSEIVAELYRAALEDFAPSLSLLVAILRRLSCDIATAGVGILETPIHWKAIKEFRGRGQPFPPAGQSRMALVRLILNRNRKEGEPMIAPQVFETPDPAYNCGRLLAVLAESQAKAHDHKLEGPGIAERYYGTASVSPSSVFPILLRLNRHHLEKIRASDEGAKVALERRLQGIVALFQPNGPELPPEFPRLLNLQDQGRFAIGFYQQKAVTQKEIDEYKAAKAASKQIPKSDDDPAAK